MKISHKLEFNQEIVCDSGCSGVEEIVLLWELLYDQRWSTLTQSHREQLLTCFTAEDRDSWLKNRGE